MTSDAMKFGIFHPPYHPLGVNPNLAIHRDLKLMEHLDDLGYDEAWIGEHHSGGWELIPSPELFIATAAERTRNIRFGTGVVTIPYHNPFMVAERITMLDHLTRGRVMLGVGAGALASDAHQIGLDPMAARGNLAAGLEAVMALLRNEGLVDRKEEWFELHDAQIHLPAYTRPHVEVAVASTTSPTGAKLAGRNGASMLSLGLWSAQGAEAVRNAWSVHEEAARDNGHTSSRDRWRIVGISYVARTDREARQQCKDNLGHVFDYLSKTSPFPPVQSTDPDDIIDELNEGGIAMIGTPQRAVDRLAKLHEDTGGFGTFLILNGDWAHHKDLFDMYDVFADEVVPHFQGSLPTLQRSYDWVTKASDDDPTQGWVKQKVNQAIAKATADFAAEQEASKAH